MSRIQIKRVYAPYAPSDGFRVLVDRIWPRGIKKEELYADLWLKDIAPSSALRKWFAHDPEKWQVFIEKYRKELQENPAFEVLENLREEHPALTLLFAARDEKHNHAQVLSSLLNE